MCFTRAASLLFAASGAAVSANMYLRGRPFSSYMHALFYSGMEALQFFQYFFVECTWANSALTKVAYLYIWLQPLLYNWFYLLTNRHNRAVFRYNIFVSACVLFYALDRLFWGVLHGGAPRADEISSGTETCTYFGGKHLYWKFRLSTNNGLEANYMLYMLLICMPAFWVDSFLNALYLNTTFVSGILFAYGYTGNMDTTLPFWCIMSIPYVLVSHLVAEAQSYKALAKKTFYVDDLD